jgi:hypothetical protein
VLPLLPWHSRKFKAKSDGPAAPTVELSFLEVRLAKIAAWEAQMDWSFSNGEKTIPF